MNRLIRTVIVAPMTTKSRGYPTRINCVFNKVEGQIVLDQIRTIDKSRLRKKLGTSRPRTREKVLQGLLELFSKGQA